MTWNGNTLIRFWLEDVENSNVYHQVENGTHTVPIAYVHETRVTQQGYALAYFDNAGKQVAVYPTNNTVTDTPLTTTCWFSVSEG